ncbi:MAG: DUF3048 domain-containing protein [Eubacteriales bacterium]|nr:DUF3048 domain-containing protein [Eubacteriales bacterium]MDD3880894.1 DUF3048 domain-containing protein [Eubacteriales bacterium]MDD4511739.1 DUF3048 domain-containing protein [Eubacteriales bacterium]
MRKVFAAFVAFLMIVSSLSFAFAKEEGMTVIDAKSSREITVNSTFENNPVIPGQSDITGLPESEDKVYSPLMVNIDNFGGALPQLGVGTADILYDMPLARGGYTRTVALFNTAYPAMAGPIRSARVMHAELREEWDAAWVYFGKQTAEGSSVTAYLSKNGTNKKKLTFDGNTGASKYYFYAFARYSDPLDAGEKYESPHNAFASIALTGTEDGKKNTTIQYSLPKDYQYPRRPFLFRDEPPTDGADATYVTIDTGHTGYSTSYTYDVDTQAYVKYMNGKPYVDAYAPEVPLVFNNVIVQRITLTYNKGVAANPLVTEIGEGNADIFMGGKYIAGYWVRKSRDSRTIFFDAEGNELRLMRGTTAIIMRPVADEVSYK